MTRRRTRLTASDRTFVACCKEEIADGSRVVIVTGTREKADAMAELFTDEELDLVEFRIGDALGPL